MTQSLLTIRSMREKLHGAGFKGSVRSLDALRPVPARQFLCAVLICSKRAPGQLFINLGMECEHEHLVKDVMDLVDAFARGRIDHGWEQLPNGQFRTSIVTRQNAMRAGVNPTMWASNPNK